MNILIWLIVGGVIGWLASIIMRTDGQQGVVLNVVVGIVGAFVGRLLLGPLMGSGSINSSGFSPKVDLLEHSGSGVTPSKALDDLACLDERLHG